MSNNSLGTLATLDTLGTGTFIILHNDVSSQFTGTYAWIGRFDDIKLPPIGKRGKVDTNGVGDPAGNMTNIPHDLADPGEISGKIHGNLSDLPSSTNGNFQVSFVKIGGGTFPTAQPAPTATGTSAYALMSWQGHIASLENYVFQKNTLITGDCKIQLSGNLLTLTTW